MRKLALPLLAGGLVLSFSAAHGAGAQSNPGLTPPPPPPGIGGTVVPPPAPGATSTPTAVPTAVPLTLRVRLARRTVAPVQRQTVNVQTAPAAKVHIVVRFPNGYEKTHTGTAGSAGTLIWQYTQPGSRVTKTSRLAKVFTQVSTGKAATKDTRQYTVAFGTIDIAIAPHSQKRGGSVTIWVHTYHNTAVKVFLAQRGHTFKTLPLRTGAAGWLQVRYVIPPHASRGTVTVRATVQHGKRATTASLGFTVK